MKNDITKGKTPLNVLVIGTGMYVCGRGTDSFGTVMPAILEWAKSNTLGELYIAGNSVKGIHSAKDKIRKLCKKMGISISPRYFSYNKKMNAAGYLEAIKNIPGPACAIIAVPDNLHYEVAKRAIEEGLHTLVVKPFVPTVKEAIALTKLQAKKRVHCAVEFHKRYDYANLLIRDSIRKGAIGDPLYFLVEFSQRKTIPEKIFKEWVRTTNVFQYLGIHYADMIYFCTGARPRRAMAIGQKNWLRSKGIDVHDSIESIIEWEMPSGKKFSSCILTNWIDPESTSAMSDQKIKVVGTRGRVESDQKNRGISMVTDIKGIEEPNPYFCAAYGKGGEVTYKGYGIDSIQQFLNDVKLVDRGALSVNMLHDRRPTFKESIVPTSVLEAVNKSLKRNGAWVEIKKVTL